MTVYNKASGIVDTLDARETAPAAAKVDMFHGNPEASTKGKQVPVPGPFHKITKVFLLLLLKYKTTTHHLNSKEKIKVVVNKFSTS